MPKERRDRSVSFDRFRASPYPCSSSRARQLSPKSISESEDNVKEWEEARCPVCMEHPHNAVLLLCASHEKGCRPYMCDTSYRHSNCLDQFRKSISEPTLTISQPEERPDPTLTPLSEAIVTDLQEERSEEDTFTMNTTTESCEDPVKPKLLCPLCRGEITGWTVVEPARHFMNAKSRSCSCETCDFTGMYTDLRKHARLAHPLVRPSEADPERQRNWRRLERQRDFEDLLSTLRSSFGEERGDNSLIPIAEGGLLTVLFLFRVFPRSSSWSGSSRVGAQVTIRRRSSRHWGEESFDRDSGSGSRDDDNNDAASDLSRARARALRIIRRSRLRGEENSRDENNESSDGGLGVRSRRTRRRTTPDNDQP